MEYRMVKLKEVANITMGQSPKGSSYNKEGKGTPFLQGNKTFGKLYPSIDKWTTEPTKIGKKGTVLMSVRAPVGDLNIANQELCIGRGLCSIEMKNGNNEYLYYLLKNAMKEIKKRSTGTVFASINKKELEEIKVWKFNREEQIKIAKVLSNIDKKIELNNKINDNLCEHLKILYEEKVNKYKNLELPKGWKYKKLKDIATFSQGVQVPIEEQTEEKTNDSNIRFIRIVDITQGNKKDIRYVEDKKRGYVKEDEIFMIRYGTPGILSRNYNGIIANNLFKISPKGNMTSEYLFSALKTDEIQNYIKQNATSSTMPAISFNTLSDQEIIVPSDDIIKDFSAISNLIRRKQLSLKNENETLEQLRDTLLPKLINGEIDLNKIEV